MGDVLEPETKYARTQDGRYIAYQVTGHGPRSLLLAFGHGISVEDQSSGRRTRAFIDRLNGFARVIRFDRSGTGLSDPISRIDQTTWEHWVDDAIAVLDAADAAEIDVVSIDMTAGPSSMLLAATHPERVKRLVLFNPAARWRIADDYPFGMTEDDQEAFARDIIGEWLGEHDGLLRAVPSVADDEEFKAWWRSARRRGMSPSVAEAVYRNGMASDFRGILPTIRIPTLVMYRASSTISNEMTNGQTDYVVEHLPDARRVDLPGADSFAYVGDSEGVVQEIEEFLTGTRSEAVADRVLATVLFTDLVDSTEHASRLGDRAWREALDAHDTSIRNCLARFRGHEVKQTGDGFLATFDGPARGITCGMAMTRAVHDLGFDVRVGLHTGEIELRGDDIGGVAVHIAARVAAHAQAAEVLVSRTVADLVVGSGLQFVDRGEFDLKGIDGSWRLFAALGNPS